MTVDEMIIVLLAHKEGKTIQYCAKVGNHEGEWKDRVKSVPLEFNFVSYNYRVKPIPKEYWLVRATPTTSLQVWVVDPSKELYAEKWHEVVHVKEVLDG